MIQSLNFFSPLRQRDALPVVAKNVQYFHGVLRNANHFVPPVHAVAFFRNKDIFSLRQEDPLRLTRRSCEPIKLQIDRWRRRWWRRPSIGDLVLIGDWRLNDWRNLHKHPKNVSSSARIL